MSLAPDVPAELPRESAVPLVVSQGPQPRTVPGGLAGGTYEDAKAALEKVQLGATKVEEFSDDVAARRVLGVRHADGQHAQRANVDQVRVQQGTALVPVPYLARTLSSARTQN